MRSPDEWNNEDIAAFIARLRRLDGVSDDDDRASRADPPARRYLTERRLARTTIALVVCMCAVIALLAIVA